MAWKTAGADVNNGNVAGQFNNITKWTVTGQTVEGILESRTQGKYGELINVRLDGDKISYGMIATYPMHTVLLNKFKDIKNGDRVRIEYLGKVRGKSGTEYKDFAVLYDDGASAPIVAQEYSLPIAPPQDVVAEYGRLYGLLVKAKGDAVAKLIGQTCALSNDPAEALRKALDKLGVVPF